jgi:hypothetical protein
MPTTLLSATPDFQTLRRACIVSMLTTYSNNSIIRPVLNTYASSAVLVLYCRFGPSYRSYNRVVRVMLTLLNRL